MDEIQKLLEKTLKQVPQMLLEKRLAEKFKAAGLKVSKADVKKAALHILGGSRSPFKIKGPDEVSIQITDEDMEYVVTGTERFHNEQLEGVLHNTANDTADLLHKSLSEQWPEEFEAQVREMAEFRERLEHRWGRGLRYRRATRCECRSGAHECLERGPDDGSNFRNAIWHFSKSLCAIAICARLICMHS